VRLGPPCALWLLAHMACRLLFDFIGRQQKNVALE
jgi:hypothetical protein